MTDRVGKRRTLKYRMTGAVLIATASLVAMAALLQAQMTWQAYGVHALGLLAIILRLNIGWR